MSYATDSLAGESTTEHLQGPMLLIFRVCPAVPNLAVHFSDTRSGCHRTCPPGHAQSNRGQPGFEPGPLSVSPCPPTGYSPLCAYPVHQWPIAHARGANLRMYFVGCPDSNRGPRFVSRPDPSPTPSARPGRSSFGGAPPRSDVARFSRYATFEAASVPRRPARTRTWRPSRHLGPLASSSATGAVVLRPPPRPRTATSPGRLRGALPVELARALRTGVLPVVTTTESATRARSAGILRLRSGRAVLHHRVLVAPWAGLEPASPVPCQRADSNHRPSRLNGTLHHRASLRTPAVPSLQEQIIRGPAGGPLLRSPSLRGHHTGRVGRFAPGGG